MDSGGKSQLDSTRLANEMRENDGEETFRTGETDLAIAVITYA